MKQVPLRASISLNRTLLIGSTLGVLLVAPLSAQSIADGARVRITQITKSNSPHEGKFVRSSRDTIWLVGKKSDSTYAFPLSNAQKVEQSTHYKRRFWRAVTGAVIGTSALTALVFALTSASDDCKCGGRPGEAVAIAIGGLAIGAPLGAAVGSIMGGETWKTVTPSLKATALPTSRRQLQLASLTF